MRDGREEKAYFPSSFFQEATGQFVQKRWRHVRCSRRYISFRPESLYVSPHHTHKGDVNKADGGCGLGLGQDDGSVRGRPRGGDRTKTNNRGGGGAEREGRGDEFRREIKIEKIRGTWLIKCSPLLRATTVWSLARRWW